MLGVGSRQHLPQEAPCSIIAPQIQDCLSLYVSVSWRVFLHVWSRLHVSVVGVLAFVFPVRPVFGQSVRLWVCQSRPTLFRSAKAPGPAKSTKRSTKKSTENTGASPVSQIPV